MCTRTCIHTCVVQGTHPAPTYIPTLTHRLVLSSSSESMKLLDSSSLLSTVDALSGGSPRSRRRSPLGCPLVRAAVGTAGTGPGHGIPWKSREAPATSCTLSPGSWQGDCRAAEGSLGSRVFGSGTSAKGLPVEEGPAGAWGAHGGPREVKGMASLPSSRFRRRARSRRWLTSDSVPVSLSIPSRLPATFGLCRGGLGWGGQATHASNTLSAPLIPTSSGTSTPAEPPSTRRPTLGLSTCPSSADEHLLTVGPCSAAPPHFQQAGRTQAPQLHWAQHSPPESLLEGGRPGVPDAACPLKRRGQVCVSISALRPCIRVSTLSQNQL